MNNFKFCFQFQDTQKCDITLESWGHPNDVLIFLWNRGDVKVNKDITLNQHLFQIELLDELPDAPNFSTGKVSPNGKDRDYNPYPPIHLIGSNFRVVFSVTAFP